MFGHRTILTHATTAGLDELGWPAGPLPMLAHQEVKFQSASHTWPERFVSVALDIYQHGNAEHGWQYKLRGFVSMREIDLLFMQHVKFVGLQHTHTITPHLGQISPAGSPR